MPNVQPGDFAKTIPEDALVHVESFHSQCFHCHPIWNCRLLSPLEVTEEMSMDVGPITFTSTRQAKALPGDLVTICDPELRRVDPPPEEEPAPPATIPTKEHENV